MKINVQAKNDYSYLFSGMNSRNSSGVSGMSGLLTEYSSIKTGSYGKLVKAYYKNDAKKEVNQVVGKKDALKVDENVKAYNKVSASADALTKDTNVIGELKADASSEDVYKAVSNFVKDYNSLKDAAEDVSSKSVASRMSTIQNNTAVYSKDLEKIGIKTDNEGKLTLDKDALAKSDVKDVQKLFSGRGSYGTGVSLSAGMAASNANYEATRSSLYTGTGKYQISTGNMYNEWF